MKAKNSHCGYCGHRYVDGQPWPRQCKSCGETSFQNPAPVAVILVPVGGGLLVIRRGIEPHRGKLALPGGYVDWGETWQQAGAREVREETGLTIAAETIVERRIMSATPGLVLIFGQSAPLNDKELPAFAITDETTERLIIREPIELAFPLHTQVMREYFAGQSPLAPLASRGAL